MSCLSNRKAFVPLALRLIGLCGLPESRCYIIDAVSFFSVYRQYTNKLPPLWHKRWDSVDAYVCVCVSTTCSNFSVLVMLALGYLLDRIWIRGFTYMLTHKHSQICRHEDAVDTLCSDICGISLCCLFLFWAEEKDLPRQSWAEHCGAQAHVPQQKEGCGCLVGASLSCKWNTTGKWKMIMSWKAISWFEQHFFRYQFPLTLILPQVLLTRSVRRAKRTWNSNSI